MRTTTVYTPVSRSRLAPPEETAFFMMNALLYSRLETGYPTNHEFFDEDVNVYLAGMLAARIYGGAAAFREDALADAARSDASLYEAAAGKCRRGRFDLYRCRADEILVSFAVFRNPRARRPGGGPMLRFSDRFWIGRGETYYGIASSLGASLLGKAAGVVEALGKLSRRFERYAGVLSHLGGEHLGIVRGMSEGEIYHLVRPGPGGPSRETVAEAYDRFLDCYSAHRRAPSARTRRDLESCVSALRALDPSFSFDIEKAGSVRSL